MNATLSAGFLFLGSILSLSGQFPIVGIPGGLLLVTAVCSGVVLACEMFASCFRKLESFFVKHRLPNLKDLVTPPPAENIMEVSNDDRPE